MGIKPSAEIPGEDSGAILGNDQVGQVYANIRLVAQHIDELVHLSDNVDAILAIDVITVVNAANSAITSAADALVSKNAAADSATAADASETAAAGSASTASTANTSAQSAKTAAETARDLTLGYRDSTLTYRDTAQGFMNSASASAIAAGTSAADALAYRNAAQAAATAAGTSETNAAASAATALAAKVAAELAETNAETAETNAETAQAAAYAAQLAAEAARDEAEGIAGGDIVTGTEFDAGMALKSNLAGGNIFTGNQNFTGLINSFGTTVSGAGGLTVSFNTPGTQTDIFFNSHNPTGTQDGSIHAVKGVGVYLNGAPSLKLRAAGGDIAAVTSTGITMDPGKYVFLVASPYGAGWNGSLKAATEDAVYDEIEALKALVVGSVKYISTWNANTNVPAIPAAAAGNKGYYYKVATAGATSIDGITDWKIGDWIISTGTAWEKVDNTDQVSTVNSQTGAVVLNTSHIAESGNLYFTTARVLSTALTGFSSAAGGSIVAADTVLAAFGKAQNSIDTLASAIADVQNGYAFTGPISTVGDLTTTGVNAGVQLGDRDLTGNITLYNDGNFFRVYINAGDRFTVDGSGNIVAGGGITATNGSLSVNRTSGANAIINLKKGAGNTFTIQCDEGNLYLTGPVLRNRAAGHYWETEDGVTLMGQLGLDSGIPKLAINGSVFISRASNPGHLGYRLYNGGGVTEWEIHHPASGDSNDLRIATVVAGTYTNRLTISPSGVVNIAASLTTPTIVLNGTDLGATLNNKAQLFTGISSLSTSFTAGDTHNNCHLILSGASRTLTLNSSASVGCSFTTRFTTAWTITCTSLSKNGATPASGGSVAAGKSVTFLHEGSGTWIAWGDIT